MRGFLGTSVMLAIIGALSWECLAIICMEYRVWLPATTGWMRTLSFSFGPPVLTALSLFARVRARRWRRMEHMRDRWPGGASGRLARGQIHSVQNTGSKSLLEGMCGLALFLGLAAIPYWLHLPNPGWALLAGLCGLWIMRRLLR